EMIFLDVVMTLSYLLLPWFILVSVIVVVLEAGVLTGIWKNWRLAAKISLIANLGSVLIAILLLFIGFGPLMLHPINVGANIIMEDLDLFSNLAGIFWVIALFTVPFVISVFIEAFIGKTLQVPQEKILRNFFIPNFVSYSLIFITLIGSGILVATVYQGPYFEIFDYFNGVFIRTVPVEESPISVFIQLFWILTIYLSISLIIILPKLWYRKQQS
ncbi:MAG: hypothetical protein ACFFDT_08005, partial [Candidatus Hodarchaeota archaeon]